MKTLNCANAVRADATSLPKICPMMDEIGYGNGLVFVTLLKERLSPKQLAVLESEIPLTELRQLVHTLSMSAIETYQTLNSE